MFLNLNKINKNKIAAWAVHGFTGSGAVLGFLAIIAILNSDAVGAFLWLGLALLIDGLDGCLLYTSPSPRDLSTSRMPSSA